MKQIVSIVKVNDTSSNDEVKQAISKSIDLIGGLPSLISPNETVIIKPNLEAPRRAETASTTSMLFIKRMIELIRQIGAKPIVAEGPFMNYDVKAVFKITGIEELCNILKVDLVNLNDTETVEVQIPKGKAHKKLRIPRVVMEADKLVNLPKLKTHHLTTLTCSMKNLKGILPGRDKQLSHVRGLHQAIVDINKTVKSDLVVVDGILAMEGKGPTFGDIVKLGAVVTGTSDLAVDTVCARIMGVEPEEVNHLRIAFEDFSFNPHDVITVGTPIEEVKSRFKIPHESWAYLLAQRSAHIIDRRIYQSFRPGKSIYPLLSGLFGSHPRIDSLKCTSCGICLESCPVDAIDLHSKRIKTYRCIDCLICSELCPQQAIYIKGISQQTPK